MALKDWKKIDNEPTEIIWENKKNRNQFAISKTLAQEWTAGVNKGNGWKNVKTNGFQNKYLKNKTKAFSYAKAYMRKH